jgi:hypothetical protein
MASARDVAVDACLVSKSLFRLAFFCALDELNFACACRRSACPDRKPNMIHHAETRIKAPHQSSIDYN